MPCRKEGASPIVRDVVPAVLPAAPQLTMPDAWLMAKAARAATGAAAKVLAENAPGRRGRRQRSQDEAAHDQRKKAQRVDGPPAEALVPGTAVIVAAKGSRSESRGQVRSRSRTGGWIRVHLDNAPEDEIVNCHRGDLRLVHPPAVAGPEESAGKASPGPVQSLLRDAPAEDVFGVPLLSLDIAGGMKLQPSLPGFSTPASQSSGGNHSPVELGDVRKLQGNFHFALSSVPLTPRAAEPPQEEAPASMDDQPSASTDTAAEESDNAALQLLAEADQELNEVLAAEQAECDKITSAAKGAMAGAEGEMKEVLARVRAEDKQVERDWEQKKAAWDKKVSDVRAVVHKMEEEARVKEQHMTSKVARMKLLACSQTTAWATARDATNELVNTAKAAKQQHASSCEVRSKLGQALGEKEVKKALAKLEEAERQTCLIREKVAEAQDDAYSPETAAAADQRDAAMDLEQALAQEDKAKEHLAAVEQEAATIQKSAEAAMHQEKLVFQKREAEAERIAREFTASLNLQQVTMRVQADVEIYLAVTRRGVVAPLPAGTPLAQRQLREQQSKSRETSRRLQDQEDQVRRALAEREASVSRALSASVQERRLANDAMVQAADTRARQAESEASRSSLEIAEAEACAAEEAAAAAQQSAFDELEDAEVHEDQQAKKLVEQLAEIERAIPKALDAARSAYLRRARALEEELAKAKQEVTDQPRDLLSQWAERVTRSYFRLEALRQAVPAILSAQHLCMDRAEAAEVASPEAVRYASSNAERHHEECKTEELQAEEQAKLAVHAAQNELVRAQTYLAEAKKLAAETHELQGLAHREEMEAVSQKAIAHADAMTRERLALQEREREADVEVRAAQLQAPQIIEDAKREAEQLIDDAKTQLADTQQQADDAFYYEQRETNYQVSLAQEAAEAAKAKAASEIDQVEKAIDKIVQQYQEETEDAEWLAKKSQDEMRKAEEADAEVLRETEAERQQASAEMVEAVASRKRRLHLAKAASADDIEKVSRRLREAQQSSETVCRDVAVRIRSARLAEEQLSRELDQMAAEKEKEAVEELAEISVGVRAAGDEAKAKRDEFAAEIEAAQTRLQEQRLAGEERRKAAERWGSEAIRKAQEDFATHDSNTRLLESQLPKAQLALEEGSRLAREAQQAGVKAMRQRNEAKYVKTKVMGECTQKLAKTMERMEKDIEEGRTEMEATISSRRKDSLDMAERRKFTEAKAQAEEEALAGVEQSSEEQLERERKERAEELDALRKLADQRETKAGKLMDCAHHVKDYVSKAEGDLADYFQKSLDTRDAPSPFTPPASERDATADASHGRPSRGARSPPFTPLAKTPGRALRSGAINRVSSSGQAPGWGSLRSSVKSSLYERSLTPRTPRG